MNRHLLFSLLCCTLTLLAGSAAASAAPPDEKTLSPYFFVEDAEPGVDALPLKGTKVEVAIVGPIADVRVTQTYENTGKKPINARYVFPASTRAAVHGLEMTVGDQVIRAKIKEKEAARRQYDAAKAAGKNAALLEQDRPNVFTMRVANVMPKQSIVVSLRYTELIVPTSAVYEFVFPTVVGPRYSNRPAAKHNDSFVQTPYLPEGRPSPAPFELTGSLSTPLPVKQVTSPSHRLTEQRRHDKLIDFSLPDAERLAGDRDFVLRYRLAGDAVSTGLSLYEANGERFFLLAVEPPARVAAEQMPPREIVFIVDVSGSMHGFPIETAKLLMKGLLGTLRSQDKFNLLLFSGASQLLSPRSLPADAANVSSAFALLDAEQGGGGTELLPALERALKLSPEPGLSRTFVVVTDGYIDADKQAIDLVRKKLGQANVFAFGIGSSVNRYLIEGLAKAGQGEPFVVTEQAQAATTARRFGEYIGAPVLTDVRVRYEGFGAHDVEPPAIGDLFAERPIVVQGKWRGAPKGKIRVTGRAGGGVYDHTIDVAAVATRSQDRALAYLWARQRIAERSDFGLGEPSPAAKAEVVRLGLRYNLLTAYTSFIAVSERVVNPASGARDVAQPLPLPLGVSELAVGGGLQHAPEPELWLLAGLVALGLGAVSVRRRRWGAA